MGRLEGEKVKVRRLEKLKTEGYPKSLTSGPEGTEAKPIVFRSREGLCKGLDL